jgi:enamine deaminase RidA (YjgF/YER057c/UK114 family)
MKIILLLIMVFTLGCHSIQQPNTLYLTVPEMSERSYSTATVAPSGARLVFISGLNAYGKKPVPKDVKAQLEMVFSQLNEALDIAGSKPECILMIKQYSTDFSDDFFEAFLDQKNKFLKGAKPSSALIPMAKIPGSDIDVEIELVAYQC